MSHTWLKCAALFFQVLLWSWPAFAQTSEFTYQGRLDNAGMPAGGNFDFEFRLFDALSGGAQQGATQTRAGLAVSDGVFTVTLDFGAGVWSGADRFLEIGVRPGGGGAFTPLTPRQKITATPYANRSLTAGAANSANALTTACVGCVTDAQIQNLQGAKITGAIPVAAVPAASGNYVQNSTATQSSANFNISGNGTVGGTLAGNVLNARNQFNLNGNRILSAPDTNLFIGVGAGNANTGGVFNSFFGNTAGSRNTSGNGNVFVGSGAGTFNVTGNFNSFLGEQAGERNTASANSFFGSQAGGFNTTGTENAFFGYAAGQGNILGSQNAFFGSNAGNSNQSNGNTFIGANAGSANTTGTSNVFIGLSAADSNATGSGNTIIGENADVGSTDLFNATAIGTDAFVTQNDSLILGRFVGVNGASTDTRVGIGTTAPSFRFHVRAAGQDGIKIQHNGTGDFPQIRWTDAADAFKASISVGPGGNEGMRFFVNGADRLIIENGGAVVVNNLGAAGATMLCRNASNQISTCSSSRRYKQNIQPLSLGLSMVNRLRPVSFDWKANGARDVGLVAEEVAQAAPELAFTNDKGEIEGVKYNQLSVVLINALQEQQTQIARQQAQIEQQARAIAALQQQLRPRRRIKPRARS